MTHVEATVTSGIHRVSFAASVGSDYKLAASLAPGEVLVGEAIHMRAALTEGGWPSPAADVTATIHRPDGGTAAVELLDDGAHGDDAPGDGIFGGTYAGTVPGGVYRFDFNSDGTTERGEPVTRVTTLSQYVGRHADDPQPGACIPCPLLRWIIIIALLLLLLILLVLWRCCRGWHLRKHG